MFSYDFPRDAPRLRMMHHEHWATHDASSTHGNSVLPCVLRHMSTDSRSDPSDPLRSGSIGAL